MKIVIGVCTHFLRYSVSFASKPHWNVVICRIDYNIKLLHVTTELKKKKKSTCSEANTNTYIYNWLSGEVALKTYILKRIILM